MAFSTAVEHGASAPIHTDNEGLEQGHFTLSSQNGSIAAYYAKPAGAQNVPIVLVIQEIFGLHEHILDVVRRVAKLGYVAVAANLYERQGNPDDFADVPSLISGLVSKVPDEQVLADLDASVAWAATQGGDAQRVGVTGFCWGGRLTWMYAAHQPKVRAGVAWYGKLVEGHGPLIKHNPIDVVGKLNGPVLGLYGALDQSIPQDSVAQMRERLAQGSAGAKASEIVVYPDANHAFFADYRPSYRGGDAADGWAKLTAWFAKYLA